MANIKIYPSISNSNAKLGSFIGSVNMPQGITCLLMHHVKKVVMRHVGTLTIPT